MTAPRDVPDRELLLVEDDSDIARVYERAFTQAGWLVRLARDGADALTLVGNTAFTAAVVDVVLPKAGGLEVVRALRARQPACRIVSISGIADPALARTAVAVGADCFIGKPIEIRDLIRAVER